MKFCLWLQNELEEKGITQMELARLSSISQATISRWLKGENTPDASNLCKVCQTLGVPEREGLLAAGIISKEKKEDSTDQFVEIPFLSGKIPCGAPIEILDEYVISSERIPRSFLETIMGRLPQKQLYQVRVQGDSMIGKGIANDDVVIFTPDIQAQSGDVVVVFIEDTGLTIKEIVMQDKIIILKPANPAYNPIVITNQKFRIIGKVLMKAGKI